MSDLSTTDRQGKLVQVGTAVRVLALDQSTLADLDSEALVRVNSMLHGIFEVYEVDSWGRAWVEKWWQEDSSNSTSHSIALDPLQMEVVE